jgi:hypothetical protein
MKSISRPVISSDTEPSRLKFFRHVIIPIIVIIHEPCLTPCDHGTTTNPVGALRGFVTDRIQNGVCVLLMRSISDLEGTQSYTH